MLLVSGCGSDCPTAQVVSGETGEVVLDVCVEYARTADERRKGLMGHAPLDESSGLIIELPVAGDACIHNVGVTFAIDVIYAGDSGRVIAVERRIPAGDTDTRCYESVRRVLEVAAGVADTVAAGDRLIIN